MLNQYTLNDLDKNGTLKAGGFLTATMFFLCRQLFYWPVTLVATRRSRASSGAEIDMSFLTINSAWEFAACLPSAIVIYLMFKRNKEASLLIRKLWANGRNLLLAGAIPQLILVIWPALNNIAAIPLSTLIFAIVHAYLIYYLFTAKRVKDVFASFPEPD